MNTMNTCSGSKPELPSINSLPEPRERFRESLDDLFEPDEPGMKKGQLFTGVLSEADAAKVPKEEPRRSKVFALAADDSVHIAAVCAAAMAWGGMHLGHWKLLWDSNDGKCDAEWLKVAQCIRDGKPTREHAYDHLRALKKKEKAEGNGASVLHEADLLPDTTRRDSAQTGVHHGPVGRIVDQPVDRLEHRAAEWNEDVEALEGRAPRSPTASPFPTRTPERTTRPSAPPSTDSQTNSACAWIRWTVRFSPRGKTGPGRGADTCRRRARGCSVDWIGVPGVPRAYGTEGGATHQKIGADKSPAGSQRLRRAVRSPRSRHRPWLYLTSPTAW